MVWSVLRRQCLGVWQEQYCSNEGETSVWIVILVPVINRDFVYPTNLEKDNLAECEDMGLEEYTIFENDTRVSGHS